MRAAYERSASHTCRVAQIGFAEIVDFKLETDKHIRHKANSEFSECVFLVYAWRATEYPVASNGIVYKCRTVRRRADDVVFSLAMTDGLDIRVEDYILKGAKTLMHASFPKVAGGHVPAQIPTHGPDMVPRGVYLMPGDFSKHGFR